MVPVRILFPALAALLIGVGSAPVRAAAVAAPTGSSADENRAGADRMAHWTATNHRTASTPGASMRRVIISGYHPAEGFEDELAAERAALGRANANAASAPRVNPVD